MIGLLISNCFLQRLHHFPAPGPAQVITLYHAHVPWCYRFNLYFFGYQRGWVMFISYLLHAHFLENYLRSLLPFPHSPLFDSSYTVPPLLRDLSTEASNQALSSLILLNFPVTENCRPSHVCNWILWTMAAFLKKFTVVRLSPFLFNLALFVEWTISCIQSELWQSHSHVTTTTIII